MTILGIDPGTLIAGYGVVETAAIAGRAPRLLEYGEIVMSGKAPLASRLHTFHKALAAVIARTHPDSCAIESAFSHKNIRSAMIIGHARGVALLAAAQCGIPVTEYSPREVKKAVTGSGAASKEQVQFMITSVLKLTRTSKSFDASDALAVALCHYHRLGNGTPGARSSASRSWKEFVEKNPGRVVPPAR